LFDADRLGSPVATGLPFCFLKLWENLYFLKDGLQTKTTFKEE
jgi:hypothetical protein